MSKLLGEEGHAALWAVAGEVALIKSIAEMWEEADLIAFARLHRFDPEACLIRDWYTFAGHLSLLGRESAVLATTTVRLSTELHVHAAGFLRGVEEQVELEDGHRTERNYEAYIRLPKVDWCAMPAEEVTLKENIVELAQLM